MYRSLTDLKMVRNLQVSDLSVEMTIALTTPNCPLKDQIEANVRADITGPRIPKLFGLRGPLEVGPVGLRPLTSEARIMIMSINSSPDVEGKPVVWGVPLVGKAITQLWAISITC